jgi:hypothetical protein
VAWIADTYRQIIAAAIADGDQAKVCAIAKEFYDRLFERPVKSWNVGRIISDGGIWAMEIEQGKWLVRCCSTKQWSISDTPGGSSVTCKQHRVAEKLGAPLAYLEGLYDAVTSLEAFHGTCLSALQSKLDRTVEQVHARCATLMSLNDSLEKAKKKLQRKSVLETVISRATVDGADMPSPPKEAISVDDAKIAFKGMSGVYFIYRDRKLLYIGKAYDVAKRLCDKSHPSVDADLVSVVRLPKHSIHRAELYYIWKYGPPANGEIRLEVRDEQRQADQKPQPQCVA